MDRIPVPVAPLKSSSFSAATNREDKLARNLSLGPIKLNEHIKEARVEKADSNAGGDAGGGEDGAPEEASEPDFATLSAEIDAFLAAHRGGESPPPVSEVTLDKFASAVEQEIAPSEGTEDKWVPEVPGEVPPLLAAIKRIAALSSALTENQAEGAKYTIGVHRVTGVLHRVMTFVEDEFHALLEDPRVAKTVPGGDTGSATGGSMRRPPSFGHGAEPDRCVIPSSDGGGAGEASPPFLPETVDRLRAMAEAMFAAGYDTECTEVFLVARRNALDASLQSLGYEKPSIDDVVKMPWEALESEVATWIKAFHHTVEVGLPGERDLCARVFAGDREGLGRDIFADLARCTMLHVLNFTEAVALTKRAAEKLFKVLDMYEVIRDVAPVVDAFVAPPGDEASGDQGGSAAAALADLKYELTSVRSRLGESAAAIFCDLESSIRADAGKQPVPGGAVHPLTRYLMNYLKYACEYKNTLEQVFQEYRRPDDDEQHEGGGAGDPFAAQLMEVMELLHGNLEAKSRLYKDPSLSSIFLMNNGRYMLQKIRGSPEINAVVGEAWSRKRSTDLRQYHKNYQRETWSRVLNLLRDDGVITVKGHVQKPVLKERFKQFNAAMDEIQRTQGAWVVSDEQLQSELRVSIAAVIVPAYRSFLGRFAQHFTAGRQTEKYVKLSGEDLEAIIEELFDGNAVSMPRRRM
ncbi:exocyst complex component EXO70B1-like [Panicum miliaceum]|uniref:Exocyst subunit Exo70 family protein n=1 Tax=Panicum miliaceum TaxID=4540 RepID=A0A3L6PJ19_PANMI|nr:exocyst complex component EXO70B1-like [Panicum miliaceum]